MVWSGSEVRSSRISIHGASGWVPNWTWGEVEWKSYLEPGYVWPLYPSLVLRCRGGDVVAGAVGSLTGYVHDRLPAGALRDSHSDA
jgi:hypothetical protein